MDRNSTNLVRFFGAEVFATILGSSLGNTVVDGQGGETTVSPAVSRLTAGRVSEASINNTDYDIAVGMLERRNVAPLAAKAMALVLLDVARIQNTSVVRLLESTNTTQLSVLETTAYKYINQLRDKTSYLSKSRATNNANSYRARYLVP